MTRITQTAKTSSETKSRKPTHINDIATWRDTILEEWKTLKVQSENAQLNTPYDQLIFILLKPIIPENKTQLNALIKLLKNTPFGQPVAHLLRTIYNYEGFGIDIKQLVGQHFCKDVLSREEKISLDWLIASTGVLSGLSGNDEESKTFLQNLQKSLADYQIMSPVRVQAGMISAGQNVVFAGRDVKILLGQYNGDKAALRSYLGRVRSEWNIPATNIHPRADSNSNFVLHELFTPPDIWSNTTDYAVANTDTLLQRRFKAIDNDLNDARKPVLESIAEHPYIVITGGAGTGKSSLCHFIVTALSYSCDPKAAKKDKIDGLKLLGPAWIHHELLPIYVSLRDFANDTETFPDNQKDARAQALLTYIKKRSGSFGVYLDPFLTQTDVETHGTMLVLDGLDEVYDEEQRVILRSIIENWATRFTGCRIILTSRTYAYKQDARWRLSTRFKSVELAPFTWRQIKFYIECWYQHAAATRPSTFGGGTKASQQAQIMAKDLIKSLLENKPIWPLARQPLMLALLTLIHEDYKQLPSKKANLYEQTVDLLDRWNIPSPADKLHEKLSKINLERMRAALKHIAYDLQSQQKSFETYPASVERSQLLDKLMIQQLSGEGLGANIEDVLEYLATRNGIIVSDIQGVYRFPHLSIQEYLAACALIEFYDECTMPDHLQPASIASWTFPENIVALLRDEPFRWRQVALFAGSIIAANKGQDLRWDLIDELLPIKLETTVSEADLHCIAIAAEIWSESWLKPRKRSQLVIQLHLRKCLIAIENDERLDAPEHIKATKVLATLDANQE